MTPTVAEFRDLVDAVCDSKRSLQSCIGAERDAEAYRTQQWVRELRECTWPKRLNDRDRAKALAAMDSANSEIAKGHQHYA